MPKIAEKRPVLNGRGNVLLYAKGTGAGKFYYREIIKGTKNYKSKLIDGASSMDEACEMAIEVAFQLAKEETDEANGLPVLRTRDKQGKVKNRKRTKQKVGDAVSSWLRLEEERANKGLISYDYVSNKRKALKKFLLYLMDKNIETTDGLNDVETLKDYPLFRYDTTPVMRKQELKVIKNFYTDYLVPNELIDAKLLLNKSTIPTIRIKQTDLLKNPAINGDDWKIIIDFIRDEWRKRPLQTPQKQGVYFRNLFWHFVLFAKNTGMSGEEIVKLRWKQIEIVDVGRIDSKGKRVKWEVAYISTTRSKTQQTREIPVNQARELRRLKTYVMDTAKANGCRELTIQDLVFSDPTKDYKGFSYSHYIHTWMRVLGEIEPQLKGHRHSPHNYTLYSLRSTFIEDHLLKGTPVMEVAEMAGHDIRETQRTYARLNLRKKGREITMPKLGMKPTADVEIDLFDDEQIVDVV